MSANANVSFLDAPFLIITPFRRERTRIWYACLQAGKNANKFIRVHASLIRVYSRYFRTYISQYSNLPYNLGKYLYNPGGTKPSSEN
jgi:hypothetical protein